ncbi:hypothetical protein QQ44_27905 [Mycolicibacterium setense]|uniref:Integrase catalytic domain-containing protein n=1 Tax=Mycolicibacterium setense TaxID=431269 RepID=A0ABR4YNS6_9MYCO|nr:hypothetical protein QQ44_27905 [Mycolicibacterium setense]
MSLEDLILDPVRTRVFKGNRGKALVVDVFASILHSLRDRVNEVFCVGDLLLNELQLAFDSLGRGLTELMITDDSRSLIESCLSSRTFPKIGELHSLPTGRGNNLIPQVRCQSAKGFRRRADGLLVSVRPRGIDQGLSTVLAAVALFRHKVATPHSASRRDPQSSCG